MIRAFASGVHCRRSRPAGITSIGRARPFPLLSKLLSNVVTSPIASYAPDTEGAQHNDLRTRSEEHTSELQSLMRISYAVFCLKKKKKSHHNNNTPHHKH